MEGLKRMLRRAAPLLSPRHRRWRRLLASLDYDPARDRRGGEEPGERDFIICGCPRTGTSLLSAQLFQPPRVVTVMEPWDGMRMPVADLFRSLRSEIAAGTLRRGKLDIGALSGEGRVRWYGDGEEPVPVEVTTDFLLGVKWPAFWRYVGRLPGTRFLVCVRHPVDTIASFKRSGGRLVQGLNYDVAFNREMNDALLAATADPALRRALLYEYINGRLLAHLDRPNVLVVRYERWFTDAEALRGEIGDFLGVELGPWPATIRPAESAPETLSGAELAMIEGHCPSAVALGYRLGGAAS